MGASGTWNVEINLLAYKNEMFSLRAEFHLSLSLFYLKDWAIVYDYFGNFFYSIQSIFHLTDFIIKFSYVLYTFNCSSAIGNLWSIWLGVNILRCKAKCEGRTMPWICGNTNIERLKTLKTFFYLDKKNLSFQKCLFLLSLKYLDFGFLLNCANSINKLLWFSYQFYQENIL